MAQQKERFAYHASHDSLTGLINRREFEMRLHAAIDRSRIDRSQYSVFFIDLDRFKIINDSCG
ncbi:MAG: diguanylate cyclase, partial [Gammaproteobacteria bacterium]|nr:diguanylate cyclase [Gammaproteobacteria bacterium]